MTSSSSTAAALPTGGYGGNDINGVNDSCGEYPSFLAEIYDRVYALDPPPYKVYVEALGCVLAPEQVRLAFGERACYSSGVTRGCGGGWLSLNRPHHTALAQDCGREGWSEHTRPICSQASFIQAKVRPCMLDCCGLVTGSKT